MLQRPQFSDQEAIQTAQDIFGIEGIVKSLPSERDQNFHLTTIEDRHFVLKISGKAEARDILDYGCFCISPRRGIFQKSLSSTIG